MSAPFSTRRLADVFAAIARRASGKLLGLLACEVAQEEKSGGEVGGRDRDRQSPLEAVAESLGERGELGRDTVGGEDQLRAVLVQRVEGVEELIGGPGLALEKLDVVDQEHVGAAIALLERVDAGSWSDETNSLVKHSAVV